MNRHQLLYGSDVGALIIAHSRAVSASAPEHAALPTCTGVWADGFAVTMGTGVGALQWAHGVERASDRTAQWSIGCWVDTPDSRLDAALGDPVGLRQAFESFCHAQSAVAACHGGGYDLWYPSSEGLAAKVRCLELAALVGPHENVNKPEIDMNEQTQPQTNETPVAESESQAADTQSSTEAQTETTDAAPAALADNTATPDSVA